MLLPFVNSETRSGVSKDQGRQHNDVFRDPNEESSTRKVKSSAISDVAEPQEMLAIFCLCRMAFN